MYHFNSKQNRYASVGTISSLPPTLIDSIWMIIDIELKGLFPLTQLLSFDLENNNGNVSMRFSQADSDFELGVDIPYPYNDTYPKKLLAFDDGMHQTVMLPSEIQLT